MIRWILKRILPVSWQKNLIILQDLHKHIEGIRYTADKAAQGVATLVLSDRPQSGSNANGLSDYEFRVRSQSGEDGILSYLFKKVGTTNRTFVEFGIQDGAQCNAAHLALSCGWNGLFIEANAKDADLAREYYSKMIDTKDKRIEPVRVAEAYVSPDNINNILETHGLKGEIDLLSIDIDSYDYWVWKAIEQVRARVVAIEYNADFGPAKAVTVPMGCEVDRPYFGASLSALAKVGLQKGYALVGCSSNGVNAFFVQRTLLGDGLVELTPGQAFRPFWGKHHGTLDGKILVEV
jgi:hypothetical protein